MSEKPEQTLDALMKFIGERYRFTDEEYPSLPLLRWHPEKRAGFILKHAVLHMNKSLGVLATEAEAADHGGDIDGQKINSALAKMLISILKLAEERGLTGGRLAALVPEVMKSK